MSRRLSMFALAHSGGCVLVPALVAATVISACGHDKPPAPKRPEAEATPVEPDVPEYNCEDTAPFLYRIVGDGEPSHVLGTIHMGLAVENLLKGDCSTAFDEAGTLVLEADTHGVSSIDVMGPAVSPAGTSLRQLLGDDSWETLLIAVGRQMPPPLLDRVQPWFAYQTLASSRIEEVVRKRRDGPREVMDARLLELARQQKKQVAFLETPVQQMALFSKVPLDQQLATLKGELQADTALDVQAVLDAYREGDEPRLSSLMHRKEEIRKSPAFHDALLFKRHTRWAATLAPRLHEGGLFVAVDAAHLVGERNFLAALAKAGFRVNRVP